MGDEEGGLSARSVGVNGSKVEVLKGGRGKGGNTHKPTNGRRSINIDNGPPTASRGRGRSTAKGRAGQVYGRTS